MTGEYLTDDDLHEYKRDTDAEEIRKTFGVAPFWKVEKQLSDKEHPLPNSIVHTQDGSRYGHAGGTNWLAVGKKGSGKTTLARWAATQLMDVNNETVVWRGAQPRSEWLPLKHWATVYLPANCDIAARWVPEDITQRDAAEPADIEDVVRDVYYYDGLRDLLSALEPHQFAVVYPDPRFRGCNEIMQESSYAQEHIEYRSAQQVSADPDLEAADTTPLIHWWIAFSVARLEGWGDLLDWTTLIFDEVADLLPQSARANRNQTYEKMEVMRKVMADSRKYRFSIFCFAQAEPNVHSKIRRTFQWRVSLPDEEGNPCRHDNDKPPVGFRRIPMIKNFLIEKNPGYGLCWTPSRFTRFTWSDYPDWEEDASRRLKILVESDGSSRARVTESDTADPPTPDSGGADEPEVVGGD